MAYSKTTVSYFEEVLLLTSHFNVSRHYFIVITADYYILENWLTDV